MNPIKKGNLWRKLFLDKFKSSSEKLQKIISADVKTDLKQQEIKELLYIATFYKKYLQNL